MMKCPTKSRNFSLVTYLNEQQILSVLYNHNMQIKAYAYILHDKDFNEDGSLKEAHYHLVISLINATTSKSVQNWFSGFTDNNGLLINTMCQVAIDISSAFNYLTHNNEAARLSNKHIYDDSLLKGFYIEYFKNSSLQNIDNLSLALDDMLLGIPLSDIYRKYGRDFIVHYGHIRQLFNDMQKQSGGVCIE